MGWAAWACRKGNLTAGILTLDIPQRKMLHFTGKKYFSLALDILKVTFCLGKSLINTNVGCHQKP